MAHYMGPTDKLWYLIEDMKPQFINQMTCCRACQYSTIRPPETRMLGGNYNQAVAMLWLMLIDKTVQTLSDLNTYFLFNTFQLYPCPREGAGKLFL